MKYPYLVQRKSGRKRYFHFRSFIPKDLIPKFLGRKEFQISLKHVSNVEKLMVSIYLKTLTEQLFYDVRNGKNLTIDDIKDLLKSEVRNYQWFNKDGRLLKKYVNKCSVVTVRTNISHFIKVTVSD